MGLGGYLATLHWRVPFLIYLFSLVLIPLCFFFLEESKPTTISTKTVVSSPLLLKFLFPIGTLFMILFYLMPTQLPFLLKSVGINAPSSAGNALAINALGMVCSSLYYSKIKQRFSFLRVVWLSLLMMGAGYLLTGNLVFFEAILLAGFLAGLGLELFIANLTFWVLELSPPEVRGKKMGILTACLFLGQFSSPLIAEPIVRNYNLPVLFMSSLFLMGLMGITLTVLATMSPPNDKLTLS